MKIIKNGLSVFLSILIILPCLGGIRVRAAGGILIDENSFPDPNFREVIKGPDYDKDRDGYLSDYERSVTLNIHCENMGISSLKGVELFPDLEGLWCLNNDISDWDLTGNPHLKGVWCSHNGFTTLDFSANKELQWVYCFNCKLTSLDVSANTELAYLECNANPDLTVLDLRNNHKLENLFCSDCGLKSLDLSGNPMLCELDAFSNDLKSINISKCTRLKRLDIWDNWGLGDVDVSMLKDLQFYNCARNDITSLNMSSNPELAMLICSYNENLTYLNVSANPKLAYLNLECDWRLPSLDISHNPKLYHLYAFGLLNVPKIDISNNSRLEKTYKEGSKKYESKLGDVYSYTLDFGGSGEYFDDLKHEFVIDNGKKVTAGTGSISDVPDSFTDADDSHSSSGNFVTREEAVQLFYEKAGSPKVNGSSGYTDVPDSSPYAKAVKWAKDNNICFGYPYICSDTFGTGELLSREDFALMAHRFAGVMGYGTAYDYGRTDWYKDYFDIDFYGWGAFTWAIQWEVLKPSGEYCYPHGRLTGEELEYGVNKIFNLDPGASYSARVNGNGTGFFGSDPSKPHVQIDFEPFASNGSFEDFVERLYVVALGRPSEPEGKAFWSDHVGNGDLTGAECAREFLLSAEFNSRYLDDENFLKVLYGTFFNRKAEDDKEGFAFWLQSLKTSGRDTVVDCFINSTEWCNVCASFGVKSGATRAKATIASKNATAFASRLYTECLGRDAEEEGLKFWSLGLTNLELSGSMAAHEFFFSKEFNDHNFDNKELITRMYRTFMGREPDDNGMKFWLDSMDKGMTKQDVFDCFVNSPEFTKICKDYAIDRI